MTTTFTKMGAGAEFDRIRSIWKRLGDRGEGGGDDCALVRIGSEQIAISVDAMAEDVHFKIGWLTPREIGWRATAAALSDLAAVAADAKGVLISLGISAEYPEAFTTEIMEGTGEAAASVGAQVWGGDLFRSDKMFVNVAVIGALSGPAIRRSGARPGDGLWVTGRLGAPAAALESLYAGETPDASARARLARPTPRIAEAKWLRDWGDRGDRGVTSMIDISDGLMSDGGHLAAASAVKLVIDYESVPVHAAVLQTDHSLLGGEEYELLFTLSEGSSDLASDFADQFGLELSSVGRVLEGSGVQLLRGGVEVQLNGGYIHF